MTPVTSQVGMLWLQSPFPILLLRTGSDIYNIGGSTYEAPSSSVSILDCRSHTWREAPNIRVERSYPAANVIDGKIYVAGGCKDCNSPNWMEVFDPKTQAWELVSIPGAEICGCDIHTSAGMDGKVYTFGKCNGLAYEPKEGTWETVRWEMDLGWPWFSYSVIENVLYFYSYGVLKWYDSKVGFDGYLRGVEGLPTFGSYARVKLADYGGKMAVLSDKFVPSSGYKDKMIWCTVIALERRSSEEICSKVEWFETVLTVPKSCEFEYPLSATV